MRSVLTLLVVSVLIALPTEAQTPVPVGGQFQVNSYTTSYQIGPAVAADAQGNFVVAWQSYEGSYGTDTSSWSVQGQRYEVTFFADGFESGDTSSWSATTP